MTDVLERLSTLVRSQRGALLAIAYHEGLRGEDALEVVQDALCTFVSVGDELSKHSVASLKTIVRNEAKNARRKRNRRARLLPVDDGVEPSADGAHADELLAHAEDVVRLRLCVAKLCDIQRSVVLLRLLEERSGEDVAETLGLTRGHVDVLVHRARASLRVCMRHPVPARDG